MAGPLAGAVVVFAVPVVVVVVVFAVPEDAAVFVAVADSPGVADPLDAV
jgi:hypothetical protein